MTDSILQSEIEQQPVVIQNLLDQETKRAINIANQLRERFHHIVIAARGTSDNAARYAQYLFGSHNHLPVALATPSLFTIYEEPPQLLDSLVVGISQSGQSPDIVSVLEEGKKQNRPTLAIVNDEDSPLAQIADFVIPLHAGIEKATAATKTYTASLAALALLSSVLVSDPNQVAKLNNIPEWMQLTLNGLQSALSHTERYRFMDQCTVIGRGYNYSTAFEIALKIKELTHVLAEPYSSADFRHGPIAVVHKGYPVVLIAPSGRVSENMSEMLASLRDLDSEVIMISDNLSLLSNAKLALPLCMGIPEWLSPLVSVLPGQLFAYRLTIEKGLNPDHPLGITKITETL
ncbi:MAG: SIS domain-containing protein [Anaerolineaceae bacterium]|nr:SIS domain-containing protein [Anaerolineaceae bacterium]